MTGRRLISALAAAAAAAALAGCGSGSGSSTAGAGTTTAGTGTTASRFLGGTVDPPVAAPALGLRTWDGRLRRTADYRGKVVFVTFVYAGCPDVCPLIIDNLLRVKSRMGRDAGRVAIVAVSVDPKGDRPARVERFLTTHGAVGKVDYLVGSREALAPVWARWRIQATPSKSQPELIEHSGVIWGVDPRGRLATFYPATGFSAADIAADTRVMLGAA